MCPGWREGPSGSCERVWTNTALPPSRAWPCPVWGGGLLPILTHTSTLFPGHFKWRQWERTGEQKESEKPLTSELRPTVFSTFLLSFAFCQLCSVCRNAIAARGHLSEGLESAQLAPGDSMRPGVSGTLCSPKPAASFVQGVLPTPSSFWGLQTMRAPTEGCRGGGWARWWAVHRHFVTGAGRGRRSARPQKVGGEGRETPPHRRPG